MDAHDDEFDDLARDLQDLDLTGANIADDDAHWDATQDARLDNTSPIRAQRDQITGTAVLVHADDRRELAYPTPGGGYRFEPLLPPPAA